jgi:hypothetical protein
MVAACCRIDLNLNDITFDTAAIPQLPNALSCATV